MCRSGSPQSWRIGKPSMTTRNRTRAISAPFTSSPQGLAGVWLFETAAGRGLSRKPVVRLAELQPEPAHVAAKKWGTKGGGCVLKSARENAPVPLPDPLQMCARPADTSQFRSAAHVSNSIVPYGLTSWKPPPLNSLATQSLFPMLKTWIGLRRLMLSIRSRRALSSAWGILYP